MNTRANRKIQSDDLKLNGRHAVVLGGSLAGLLAARILSDHFEKVTILERDAYLETTEVRKGVPQANHVHGLLLRGRQVLRTLHELDEMGVKLALDDFGTGESSLSLLRLFPAAIVKLDKSFVDGIEIDDGDPAAADARQAVARAVSQLAGALRLDTVAEGVENEAQVAKLRELGYTLGQGYHLARPMPPVQFGALLAAQRKAVVAAR